MVHRPLLGALLCLAAACSSAAQTPCGLFANDAGCGVGEYCNCAAGQTTVDERQYRGCAPLGDGGTDPAATLPAGGAEGVCRACTWTAHCLGGTWNTALCACD